MSAQSHSSPMIAATISPRLCLGLNECARREGRPPSLSRLSKGVDILSIMLSMQWWQPDASAVQVRASPRPRVATKRRGHCFAHYQKWTGTELVKCQQTEWSLRTDAARARGGENRKTGVWHCWTGRTPWAAPLTRGQRRRQRPARSGRAVQPYVCLSVCVRLHVLCIHACMYTCMHACMHACIYACMFVCMHVCMMFICLWFGTLSAALLQCCVKEEQHVYSRACTPSAAVL